MISVKNSTGFKPTNFAVLSRNRYATNVDSGTIPHSLKPLIHTMPWPIDMDENKYILTYNGQLVSSGRRIYNHNGIDIMCNPNTPVKCVENGAVVFCERDDRFGKLNELADVYINSNSGILWVYRHLDINSIPNEILMKNEYDPESTIQIKAGESIGRVGSWKNGLNSMDIVPAHYKRRFNNTPHHLHLEALVNLNELNGEDSLNPLIVLKRLSYLEGVIRN